MSCLSRSSLGLNTILKQNMEKYVVEASIQLSFEHQTQ